MDRAVESCGWGGGGGGGGGGVGGGVVEVDWRGWGVYGRGAGVCGSLTKGVLRSLAGEMFGDRRRRTTGTQGGGEGGVLEVGVIEDGAHQAKQRNGGFEH